MAGCRRVAAGREAFWIHNPGTYLKKPRYVLPLLRHRPVIVTIGPHHAATVPRWMPSGGRAVMVLLVDTPVPQGLIAQIREVAGLEKAQVVAL